MSDDGQDHVPTPSTPCSLSRRFESPAAWLAADHAAMDQGVKPPVPWSREELLLAEKERLLELHPYWLPARQGLKLLGLPPYFGRRLKKGKSWRY